MGEQALGDVTVVVQEGRFGVKRLRQVGRREGLVLIDDVISQCRGVIHFHMGNLE